MFEFIFYNHCYIIDGFCILQTNVLDPTVMALFEPKEGDMIQKEEIERFHFVLIFIFNMI